MVFYHDKTFLNTTSWNGNCKWFIQLSLVNRIMLVRIVTINYDISSVNLITLVSTHRKNMFLFLGILMCLCWIYARFIRERLCFVWTFQRSAIISWVVFHRNRIGTLRQTLRRLRRSYATSSVCSVETGAKPPPGTPLGVFNWGGGLSSTEPTLVSCGKPSGGPIDSYATSSMCSVETGAKPPPGTPLAVFNWGGGIFWTSRTFAIAQQLLRLWEFQQREEIYGVELYSQPAKLATFELCNLLAPRKKNDAKLTLFPQMNFPVLCQSWNGFPWAQAP